MNKRVMVSPAQLAPGDVLGVSVPAFVVASVHETFNRRSVRVRSTNGAERVFNRPDASIFVLREVSENAASRLV